MKPSRAPLLEFISEEQFDRWPSSCKVIQHEHARKFASLLLPDSFQRVVLSWQSDLIDPIVISSELPEIWIGVDERVVSVTAQGIIVFSIGLETPLLDIKQFNDCTVILCETEVVLVDENYSIRKVQQLNDVADSITFCDGRFVVRLLGGKEVNFS